MCMDTQLPDWMETFKLFIKAMPLGSLWLSLSPFGVSEP